MTELDWWILAGLGATVPFLWLWARRVATLGAREAIRAKRESGDTDG